MSDPAIDPNVAAGGVLAARNAATPTMTVTDRPSASDRTAILDLLRRFNSAKAPPAQEQPLAILLHDADGAVIGGLHAVSAYDWLIVELVFVPEPLRGQGVGSALLAEAEEAARVRGCRGIWLDTFSFQARGFYEALGYTVFGTVGDHPAGAARYFLKKMLD